MSALVPIDESYKNKSKRFQRRNKAIHFPIVPLTKLRIADDYVYCPDDFELEYPCNDKSSDVVDFSQWSYFKNQAPAKIVSKKGCGGWNPELLRKMREPLKPIEKAHKRISATPRKTHAQLLREKYHPPRDRDSDVDAMSASTESLMPRPRTPRIKITEEELHAQLLAKQDEAFRAQLEAAKGSSMSGEAT
jgi:hypothetical protein